ncbi:MAG TPA: hypothetical protein VKB45_16415 [Gemmatimonadales bacterium]|nr:hypothetical protein [Gemmatimonadales bacterium]
MIRSPLRVLLSLLAAGSCAHQPSAIQAPPDVPAAILLVAGDSQTAVVTTTLPIPLRLRILNAPGQPLSGDTLDVSVTTGSGTVTAGTLVSDSVGEAVVGWTMGTEAGTQSLAIRTRTSISGAPLTVAATAFATPGPLVATYFATRRVHLTGDSVWVSRIVARDLYGNPVPAPAITDLYGLGTFQQGETTFTLVASTQGRYRFVLGHDTLTAVVVLPARHLRLVEIRGDTVEALSGNLVVVQWGVSGGAPPDTCFAFYDLRDAVATRSIGGVQVDSVSYSRLSQVIYTGVPWILDSVGAHPWYGWSGQFSFHRVTWPGGVYDPVTYHPAVLDRFKQWIALGPQSNGTDPWLGPHDSLTFR